MDRADSEKSGLPQHMLCSSLQSPNLELQPTLEPQEKTPISKLCDTLTDTVLKDPVEIFQQNNDTMLVNVPAEQSQQTSLNTSFPGRLKYSVQTPLHSPCQTPCHSAQEICQQTPKETPFHSPTVTPSQLSVQTPLCVPIGAHFDIRNVNSTPRRNPRRSCIDRSNSFGCEDKLSKEVRKSRILKKGCLKDNFPISILSVDSKSDVPSHSGTSMKTECVSSDLEVEKDLSHKESDKESPCVRKSLFASGQESSLEFEVLKSVPSYLQSNKLLQGKITSEPRLSRKSDIAFTSRRLSFSSKKNKRKSIVPEYDPDNDIFAHGLMPVLFNDDSLKHKIGKFLNASDTPLQNLKRSTSCGALGDSNDCEDATPTQSVRSVPSKGKQTKKSSPQASQSTLKRTTSAPDLLVTEPSASKSDFKVTSEGTIRAFLRARDIIKNIKQRAKNICNMPTSVKLTPGAESTTTSNDATAGQNASHGSKQNCETSVQTNSGKGNGSSGVEYSCTDVYLPPTQPFESFILGDVTAYVEVISNNEDISGGIRKELMKLGATVVPSFTKDIPVTHVVFNDGRISTYKKAKKRNVPLVSVLWIEECRKAGVKVHESLFPPYQIERYESPSIVKQLKKRRIMHLYSGEIRRPSLRRKKEVPKTGTSSSSDEIAIKNVPKQKSVPKWVEEVAGDNGMMRILVNMTGIGHNEFQNLVNRPPTPDSDIEPDQNSPLPVRLLRKMAKNLPADNLNCDSAATSDVSHKVHRPKQNSFAMKLKEASESQNEKMHESEVYSVKEKNKSVSAEDGNNLVSSLDHSKVMNVTHRKKIPKRKLLSPIEETVSVIADGDGDGDDVESTAIENPHNCTPKRLSDGHEKKKRKPGNSQEMLSAAVAVSKTGCSEQTADKPHGYEINIVDPIRRSRRSSSYFVKKKKSSPSVGAHKPSLVCTLLHSVDVEVVVSIADKLGTFIVERNVLSSTTHIVTGSPKRTMKVLKGMARGCWIVAHEWVLKSLEAGKWLDEEEFELTTFSPAVQKYRLEKLSFGGIFKPDIFSACGPIFISSRSSAPRSDLVELVLLCGGKIASRVSKAKITVGKHHTGVVCVTALWILDSVQYYCCKPFDSYLCT